MNLHLDKKTFCEFIDNLSTRAAVDPDIIEKDYYVCLILKDLSSYQDNLQAYFKGGTAVYKILETMNRFSEDIDLTVKVIPEESKTQNNKRLKQSAFGYQLEGLELSKNDCIKGKGSATGIYKYESLYGMTLNPLYRSGIIKVEATSFTVSEPYKEYNIEPLMYKLANEKERKILREKFEISSFDINIIKLVK